MEFGLFITLIYLKAWISSTAPCDAPANHLCLIKDLTNYRAISQVIADTPLCALGRHLWYLGQELAPLALFSDLVPAVMKSRMAAHLTSSQQLEGTVDAERSLKYIGKEELGDKTIDYFIGQASHFFFRVLHLDASFLSLPAEQWPELNAYCHAKKIVESLKVVNDSAEHAIALATAFNTSLTKSEEEK